MNHFLRRDFLRGGVCLTGLGLLAACGGGGGNSAGTVVTPTPSPTPTPTPTPTASPSAIIRQRLRAAAAAALPRSLYGNGAAIQVVRADNDSSPIVGRRLVAWTDPAFRYVGRVQQTADTFPLNLTGTNRAVNYGAAVFSNSYFVEFRTDARVFELAYYGNGFPSTNRVLVDGKYLQFEPVLGGIDGETYASRVTLPSSELRTIRVETIGASLFGVYVGSADRLISIDTPAAAPVRGLILGDSYTEGPSAVAGVNPLEVYAAQTARALGWRDFYQSGVGNTGYMTRPNAPPRFLDRLATDVVAFNPEVLVIAGGLNDVLDGLEAVARATLDAVAAALPDTQVFVLGPWTPFPDQRAKAAAIKAAVGARANFFYVDNSDWITGNGNAIRPTGVGTGDTWIGTDQSHLTQTGHDGVQARLVSAIGDVYRTW